MRTPEAKKKLLMPLLTALIFFVAASAVKLGVFFLKLYGISSGELLKGLNKAFILFATVGAVFLVRWIIADAPLRFLRRYTITPLLNTVISLVIYSAAAMFLLNRILGMNIVPLFTTSAVLTGIVAFSLQDTIKNLFTGIWINTERVVGKGDWIKIGEREGRVMEVTWRTTRLLTRQNDCICIPTGYWPRGCWRTTLTPTRCTWSI